MFPHKSEGLVGSVFVFLSLGLKALSAVALAMRPGLQLAWLWSTPPQIQNVF